MWRWRRFKWWLGGVRHGATYKQALEHILGQSYAMARDDAGIWAVELANNALVEHEPHTNSPTPCLRNAFMEYQAWLAGGVRHTAPEEEFKLRYQSVTRKSPSGV